MRNLLITGMHGLGDNLHQRAIIRQLIQSHNIWLETSWVSVYHDLIPLGLKVKHKTTTLRTQSKNGIREQAKFSKEPIPVMRSSIRIWYPPADVKSCGGVLPAMMKNIPACDYATADFRLPIPAEWDIKAKEVLETCNPQNKPVMIYRPLNERREWSGCKARNPDYDAYRDCFEFIRDDYFVISIADLVPNLEWMVGHPIKADLEFHSGQLSFETIAALTRRASLVYTSPGFAVILGQAVETPVIALFGTYEMAYSFSGGARYSHYLGINPINPRDGFTHDHAHDKRIDIEVAKLTINRFFSSIASVAPGIRATFSANPKTQVGTSTA
jgi:hypothetical protein